MNRALSTNCIEGYLLPLVFSHIFAQALFASNMSIHPRSSSLSPAFSKRLKAGFETETSLTLVSFNVAGCEPSKAAPSTWTQSHSMLAVVKEVFQNEQKPDIVALQEVPSFAFETMLSEYKLIGYQTSHAPYVALFVHLKWNAKQIKKNMGQLPVVIAEIDFSLTDVANEETKSNLPQRRLWIASVHLEPYADGASIRKRQLQALAKQARAEKIPLIIAGDTNMRVAEDCGAENDLGMLDFWKLAGSDFRTKFTVSPVECISSSLLSEGTTLIVSLVTC
jgi:hypothetical protein